MTPHAPRRPEAVWEAGDAEFAWASGLFEGEGCIYRTTDSRRSLALVLNSTDGDVIERFCDVIGGVGRLRGPLVTRGPADKQYKPHWEWRLTNRVEATALLTRMAPWLGERRLEKARSYGLIAEERTA